MEDSEASGLLGIFFVILVPASWFRFSMSLRRIMWVGGYPDTVLLRSNRVVFKEADLLVLVIFRSRPGNQFWSLVFGLWKSGIPHWVRLSRRSRTQTCGRGDASSWSSCFLVLLNLSSVGRSPCTVILCASRIHLLFSRKAIELYFRRSFACLLLLWAIVVLLSLYPAPEARSVAYPSVSD